MKLLCTILLLWPVAAAAGDFHGLLDQLARPRLAGEPRSVEDLELAYGDASFRLTGTVDRLVAADRTVGFVFAGDGASRVDLVGGPFRAALQTTLESKTPVRDTGVYERDFSTAVFFSPAVPETLLQGEVAESGKLERVLDRAQQRWALTEYAGMDHFLAEALLNPLPGDRLRAFLWSEILGFFVEVDEADDRELMVAEWDRSKSSDRHWLDPLIVQPTDEPWATTTGPPVMVTDLDVELVSRDRKSMEMTTTVEITCRRGGVQVVSFDLLNGRTDIPEQDWDDVSHPLQVTAVRAAPGLDLEHSHASHHLLVKLPKAMRAGESLRLTVEARGPVLRNYAGNQYFFVLGEDAILPQLSREATFATFHAVVKVEAPYIAIGSGETVRRWREEKLNCLEVRAARRTDSPTLLIGDFIPRAGKDDDFDVTVYSYAIDKKSGSKRLEKNALAALSYYSGGLGPTPFSEIAVVELPISWGSAPGMVVVTGPDELVGRLGLEGDNLRYAGRLASQWYGSLVTPATPHDAWIPAAFAEYLSYMFIKEGVGDEREAGQQFRLWESAVRECSSRSSIYGQSSIRLRNYSRECPAKLHYGKGPYVLHALRQEMGEESFTKLLFFLVHQVATKEAKVTTEDVILMANAVAGEDYRPFFDRFVFGLEVPSLESD